MHSVARTFLAALLVAMPITSTVTASIATPVAYAAPVAAVDDADDLVPYVEEVRAALITLGAPSISEMDMLDSAPLADMFDEGARYVAVPSGDTGQVTMTVGAWVVEDGADEHVDFTKAFDSLKAYGAARGSFEYAAVPTGNAFGANEAVEVAIVNVSGGKPTSILVGRLARFGKAIAFTSANVDVATGEVRKADSDLSAMVSVIIAKLVADKGI